MNIIVCGLQKSGKSTIGNLLAQELNWNFIDTDCLIEKAYLIKTNKKFSCRQIVFHEGEKFFRDMENDQIASLNNVKQNVIAVGGGSMENHENAMVLKSIGYVIYLNPSWSILWNKIQKSGIPAYLDQIDPENSFFEIAKKRAEVFRTYAHLTIDTDDMNEQETLFNLLKQIKQIRS